MADVDDSNDDPSLTTAATAAQRISNDSSDGGCRHCAQIAYDGDFPVEYSCEGGMRDDEEHAETTVRFEYEARLPASADVALNMRALKWSLLNEAVRATGLLDECNFENQFRRQRRLGSSHLQSYYPKLEYPTTVVALDSEPADFPVEGRFAVQAFLLTLFV